MDATRFYIVCVRCSGAGTEHESVQACALCNGTRVLHTHRQSRVVALEFLRVAQPLLSLDGYEEASAVRKAVEGVSRWLVDHPGEVSLDTPVPTILNTRSNKP